MVRVGNAAVLTCNDVICTGASADKESARAASLQPACQTMYDGGTLPNAFLIKSLYTQAETCA